MPHAVGSGKPRQRHCRPRNRRIFREAEPSATDARHTPPLDPERPANGDGICYNVVMAKRRKATAKGTKAGGLVVGRARFTKISAVEGIQLTQIMEKRASEADRKGLTAEEYRRTIVHSYRKG